MTGQFLFIENLKSPYFYKHIVRWLRNWPKSTESMLSLVVTNDNGIELNSGHNQGSKSAGVQQWLSTFLILWHCNTVPHVVVVHNCDIISLLLHDCNIATVMHYNKYLISRILIGYLTGVITHSLRKPVLDHAVLLNSTLI